MTDQSFDIERRMPMALRLFLGAAGIFCIVVPAYDFRHAFLHPGWPSLFFGAIVAGAWTVGFGVLRAAIQGEAQAWRFGEGELTIFRASLLRQIAQTIRGEDVAAFEIAEQEWDSGPNTFKVVLRLADGMSFETPGYRTQAAAEEMERKIRAVLHRP